MVNDSIWTTDIKQSNQDELKKMLAEAEEKQTQTVNAFVEENIDLIKQLISLNISIKEIARRLGDDDKTPSSKSAIESAIKKALPTKKTRRKTTVKPDKGQEKSDTDTESETLADVSVEKQDQQSNNNGLESAGFLED